MGDYIGTNSFMQGFMQGYGFIDDIQARKRSEARLEQRLTEQRNERAYNRQRQSRIDIESQIDRNRRRGREDDLLERQDLMDEAQRVYAEADPTDYDASIKALMPYAEIPEVAAMIARLKDARVTRDDDMLLFGGGAGTGTLGAGAQNAAGVAPGAAPPGPMYGNDAPGGEMLGARPGGMQTLPNQPGQAAGEMQTLPGDPNAQPSMTALTGAPSPDTAGLPPQDPAAQAQAQVPAGPPSREELEQIAIDDPAKAARIRDANISSTFVTSDTSYGIAPGVNFVSEAAIERSKASGAAKKAADNRELTRDTWSAALDINNPTGDQFRSLPPSQQIGQYYRDRSALLPEQRANGDRLMYPHVQRTIDESKDVLANPATDPRGLDAANARRKLKESYALIKARKEFKPLEANGVNSNGLPVNGRNSKLTDTVIESSLSQPGPGTPGTHNQVAAEDRVLERGPQNGRVSSAFASAAWRKYNRKEITLPEFESLMRTGRMPSGITYETASYPAGQDVWSLAKGPNGEILARERIIKGDDPKRTKSQEEKLRNYFEDSGEEVILRLSEDLAARMGEEGNGSRYYIEFADILGENEIAARMNGYDYGNPLDIASLWKRYESLNIISDAIDDEVIFKGVLGNSFEEEYKRSIGEALFLHIPKEDLEELEIPGTTTLGMGGESPVLRAAKTRDPMYYEAMRNEFPAFQGLSDGEIEQEVARLSAL